MAGLKAYVWIPGVDPLTQRVGTGRPSIGAGSITFWVPDLVSRGGLGPIMGPVKGDWRPSGAAWIWGHISFV